MRIRQQHNLLTELLCSPSGEFKVLLQFVFAMIGVNVYLAILGWFNATFGDQSFEGIFLISDFYFYGYVRIITHAKNCVDSPLVVTEEIG